MLQDIERGDIKNVIRENDRVVILWFNEKCSPCKVQKTILKGVIRKNPDVKFYGVPTKMEGEGGVPRMQIFKGGKSAAKFAGVTERADILEALGEKTEN